MTSRTKLGPFSWLSVTAFLIWSASASAGPLVLPSGVRADLLPAVQIMVDDRLFTVPVDAKGGFKLDGPIRVFNEGDGDEELLAEITGLEGLLDPDPSIGYGIAVVDFGAPSAFGFLFFTPIVPTGVPNVVTGSIVGGLTDFTGDGVSLTPSATTTQFSEVSVPGTGMGVDVGAAFAAGPGAAGSFYAYGPFAAGPLAGPGPGPWTGLSLSVAFTLSGGGDIAALTGFASIEPVVVPEPAVLSLFGVGLTVLAVVRRRRA